MNILTGGLSIFINAVNLVMGNYYAAGTGLLFGFTYLFVAFVKLGKLNPIPFAWFSTFVAVNALVFGTMEGFTGKRCSEHHRRLALGSHLVSVGQSSGALPLWRISWAKNWANLFPASRSLKAW